MTNNQDNGDGPMRLIERYLAAVAAQLPATSREDVTAELRDDIMSRIEARQTALGRDLTDDEVEATLREVGHPLEVAARFGSGPQHLIGPELFPWWLFGVKVGLIVLVAITVFSAIIKVISGQDFSQAIGQGFAGLFSGAMTLIGIATAAGYIIERQAEKPSFITNWRVQDLGFFEVARLDSEGFERALGSGAGAPARVRKSQPMSPVARALSSAVAAAVLTAWWIGAIHFGGLAMSDWVVEVAGVDYSQAVRDTITLIFWPVVGYGVARVLFDLFRAANPRAVRVTALGDIGLACGRLAMTGWLLLVSPLGRALGITDPASVIERVRDTLQTGFSTGVWSLSGMVVLIMAASLLEPVGRILISLVRLGSGVDRRLGGTA
jgi:hypothetical protein